MTQPQYVSMDDVQRLVDEQLAKVREEHDAELAQLRTEAESSREGLQAQLDAARKAAAPTTSIPEHSGGPGLDIAETWSYAEQTAARNAAEAEGQRAA